MWWLRPSSRLDRLFALVNCASCCTARSPAHLFLSDKSSNSADPVGRAATRAHERGFSNDLQRNSALIVVALLHIIQTINAQIIAHVENIRRIRAEFWSQTRDPNSRIQQTLT
jgi:hypothetical protein